MDRVAVIRAASDRFADVLADADPAAPVPTCPDWTAADLLWHLGEVHRMWAGVLATGALTDADAERVDASGPERPTELAGLLEHRARMTDALLTELARHTDAEARWTWWPADQSVGFTRRMQTYEATFHRVDAELTAGLDPSPIDAEVAAGAVDQCLDVMWGWQPVWASYQGLGVVDLVATDTGQHWLLEVGHWFGTGPESGKEFDEPRGVRAGTGHATAVVSGTAADLALWAWTRGGTVEITGEGDTIGALERLLGNGIP